MPIKVVVEFRAQPGARAELKDVLEGISATYGPTAAGFLGSTVYETLDDADGLVEIADWDSAGAQSAAVQRAVETGIYAPLADLLAAPIKATRIG
jgi:quinol monooxygenase YgiN